MDHLKPVPELPKPTAVVSPEEINGSELNDIFYRLVAGEIAGIAIEGTEISRVTFVGQSQRIGQMAIECTDTLGRSHLFEYVCGTDEPIDHTIIEREID